MPTDYVSTVTSKGQITIPVEIRRALRLSARDRVVLRLDDGVVRVEPAKSSLAAGYGSVKLRGKARDPKKLRRDTQEWVAEQALREM